MVRSQPVELGIFGCNGELRNNYSKLVNMANSLFNGEIVMLEERSAEGYTDRNL
jgi:hypothetical protein